MSTAYYFEKCPKCKVVRTDGMGFPELAGYEGDEVECSKCKRRFVIKVILEEKKRK